MQCATHPTVETQLSCNQCGKAICFRCMIQTPVGFRCPDCSRLRPNPLLVMTPKLMLRTIGVALGLALAGGIAWALAREVVGVGGMLSLAAAGLVGWGIGHFVSRAANRKMATAVQVLSGVSALLSYGISNMLNFYWWAEQPLNEAVRHFYQDSIRGFAFAPGYSISAYGIITASIAVIIAVVASKR